MRLAIKNGESSIKEENIHSHDPVPVIERSDGTVVNPLQDDKVPSPDILPASAESPSSSSVESQNTPPPTSNAGLQTPVSTELPAESSTPIVSSSGIGLSSSTPSLHSTSLVDSGTESCAHHGSSSSISSGAPSSGDSSSVFSNRSPVHEPISSSTVRPQSTSPDHGCVPDSTTSNLSSPFSTQPHGKLGLAGRTSSADLGYRSGSASSLSLRDRLTSSASTVSTPMKRTDSNASSIVSDVSANSSMHSNSVSSLPPHTNTLAGPSVSMPEFHSQSPFQGVNSFGSSATTCSYQPQPVEHYGTDVHSYNTIQNHRPATSNGFPMHMDTTQQFGGPALNISVVQMNVGINGSPQQLLPQNELPVNGAAAGMDFVNSLPEWIPPPPTATTSGPGMNFDQLGRTTSGGVSHQGSSSQGEGLNFQTTAGPGFQFISSSLPGNAMGEEMYNPPGVLPAAPTMFVGSSASGKHHCLTSIPLSMCMEMVATFICW